MLILFFLFCVSVKIIIVIDVSDGVHPVFINILCAFSTTLIAFSFCQQWCFMSLFSTSRFNVVFFILKVDIFIVGEGPGPVPDLRRIFILLVIEDDIRFSWLRFIPYETKGAFGLGLWGYVINVNWVQTISSFFLIFHFLLTEYYYILIRLLLLMYILI